MKLKKNYNQLIDYGTPFRLESMKSEQSSIYKNTLQNLTSLASWWEEDENRQFKQWSFCLSSISKRKDADSHLLEAEEKVLNHIREKVGEQRFSELTLVRVSDNAAAEFKENWSRFYQYY